TELDRLGVEEVVLLGGEGALPSTLVPELGDRAVRRIAGPDRVATAAAIAGERGPAPDVYVAGAAGRAGAPGAGAGGASAGRPVLLVGDDVPRLLTDLDTVRATTVRVVGGERVVPPDVVDALVAAGLTVHRLAGADRYTTAAAVAADAGEDDPDHVWLAT